MKKPFRQLILAIVMLASAWLIWSQLAARQLRVRVEALRARHEPLAISEVAAPVPDARNAATYYLAAAQAISPVTWSPSSSSLTFNDYPPYPPQWHQAADQAMLANAQALALARQARDFDEADWKYAPPTSSVPGFSSLGPLRALNNLLHDSVLHAHVHANDAMAIEQAQTLLHLARTLSPHTGIFGHLTALGIASNAYQSLEIIAPDLQVGPEGPAPATQAATPGTRQAVLDLIAQLLDDRATRRLSHQAAQFARAEDYEAMQKVRSHVTVLRPMVDQETARFLDYRKRVEEALDQPTWPMAAAVLGAGPGESFSGAFDPSSSSSYSRLRYSRALSSVMGWESNFIRQEFRAMAERRIAATALAVRLYRLDHHAWPQRLDELTPAYLPHVPMDVFAAPDTPIGYVLLPGALPHGGDRPLLLFDVADPAHPGSPPAAPSFGWSKLSTGPQWRDLSRWSPPGQ